MNAKPTQRLNPCALRILVKAGTQNPGAIPWKKYTSHSRKTIPPLCVCCSVAPATPPFYSAAAALPATYHPAAAF